MQQLKSQPSNETAQSLRVVSFEPSHSWLKRHDDEGTLVIQAGYVVNPTGRFKKDDENPLVIDGGIRRWYGVHACENDHVSPLYSRKETTVVDSFKACLRPTDNGRNLHVVVSHWDEDTAHQMAQSLKGSYRVTRNGENIWCNVIDVTPELEGMGAYYLCKPYLKKGKTMLIEMGHGTSEEWVIDSDGFASGKASEELAVSKLVKRIADDPQITAQALKLGEQQVNHDLIARALKSGSIGSMPIEKWQVIKGQHVEEWLSALKGYILKGHGSTLQNVSNIVFSGGGAALVASRLRAFAVVPDDPQTASVRGAYQHHHEKIHG